MFPLVMGDRDLASGMLLLTRQGGRIAIVGGLDAAIPASTGVWTDVRIHNRDSDRLLREALLQCDPRTIAINYSRTSGIADGLSHGKYLRLLEMLEGTPYQDRLVSSEAMALELRTVKTSTEISRIQESIRRTDIVFDRLRKFLRPGQGGMEIFGFVQEQMTALGATCGWSRTNCPILTMGPVEFMGHTPPPADRFMERGWLLQVDLGLRVDGYCSDFQRMFYFLEEGEDAPPAEVQALFEAVHGGITDMIRAIGPGVLNHLPSSLGFARITGAGFPEPKYGVGHQLGRAVHDGGPGLLDCRHPDPSFRMQVGNVFTVEGLETRLEKHGWVSLEEDVVVTPDGCRVLTERQNELYCIR
jgi:Xaa-Pro aminopeptidase